MLAEIPIYGAIYYALLFQIVFREYAPGDKLPSRSEMARLFNTSERTVRRALSILTKNGYISMCRGRSPVVVYDPWDDSLQNVFLPRFEKNKGTLLDIVNSYRFLVPSFLFQGLSRMSREELLALYRDICCLLEQDMENFDLQSYRLLAKIMLKSGSQNIFLYYVTTHLYVRLNVCAPIHAARQGEAIIAFRRRMFRWAARELNLFLQAKRKIRRSSLTAVANWYLDSAVRCMGLDAQEAAVGEPRRIFQNFEPKYLVMCFELIQKIYDGQYRIGDFLPSDTAAAAEYRVAVLTARKAYKTLNELGFAKTVPQVGTQVVFSNAGPSPTAHIHLLDSPEHIGDFLDCLSFLKAAIHCMALTACGNMDALAEDFARLEKKIAGPARVFEIFNLVSLVDCVVKHTRNVTCYNYFSMIKPSLFFITYLLKGNAGCVGLLEKALEAAAHLRTRDAKAFATGFSRVVAQLADCAEKTCLERAKAPVQESTHLLTRAVTEKGRPLKAKG